MNKLPNNKRSSWGGKHIIWRIALAELQSLFYSPIAWIILTILLVQLSLTLTGAVEGLLKWQNNIGKGQSDLTLNLIQTVFGSTYGNGILSRLYLFIPLLTMGILSQEFHSGSIKLLYSSPVSNVKIILGKYLSVAVYGLVMITVIALPMLYVGITIEDFGWPHLFTTLAGVYLLICTYGAVGVFMSSLTSYQVVAAISTLAVFSFLNIVGNMGQGVDGLREITYWFSLNGRAESFIKGFISTEDVLYFFIISALFIALSIVRLIAVRQQKSWTVSIWKYAGLVLLTVSLGYVTSRPSFMAYYDSTKTKRNTLTKESQKIVEALDGELTITTFVNILDKVSGKGMPGNRKYDMSVFDNFIRFKPEIRMDYVYYYADVDDPSLHERYPGLNAKQMVEKICIAQDMDPSDFVPATEVEKKYKVDLKSEYYRMVRLLERQNGNRTFLRTFNDDTPDPTEKEITAALKGLVQHLPVVGFLQGHGERSFERQGDLSYRRISMDKLYRNSLINSGMDFKIVVPNKEIPSNIDILLIADMREPLNTQELRHVEQYIQRGGNLFVLGDLQRQQIMNPMIASTGVQFMPGQLVRVAMDDFPPDFIISRPTDAAVKESFYFNPYNSKTGISMPGCLALTYTESNGFNVIPFYYTERKKVWNTLKVGGFTDHTPVLDTLAGEKETSYITTLGLTRKINGKEQRILVSGDADCLSNGEISVFRSGISITNENMANGSFYWLSGNQVPIDTRRPAPTDSHITMKPFAFGLFKILLVWVFPALLLTLCLGIWFRRRGR